MAKFYITTTLPYVNSEPHLGFAFELVTADIIARYRKLLGDEVFFNTGTDEHGLKVFRKAQEEGKDPQKYADEYAQKYQLLTNKLGLDKNLLHFIRTTDAHHKAAAQELWRRCKKDIELRKYKGLYCVGDEAFIKETDLVDGKCPNHPTMDVVEIEEENYFFNLKKYEKQLLAYLKQEGVIVPEWRRQEAIKFVENGLEDFSVSRLKEKMPWGVPVPDDDSQIMYVWFDALTNYISTLSWPFDSAQGKPEENLFEKFWVNGETLQLAGKDQVRFQSIMWQTMLMSAGLPTTKQIVYHGFVTSGGQKMSKSLGNVIDPVAIVDEYGTDALRYFLARHIHPFEDSDFTMERFKDAYNADLANSIGNLAARVMQLAQSNLNGPVKVDFVPYPKEFTDALDAFKLNEAVEYIAARIHALDQKINQTEPFKLVKTESAKGKALIEEMVRELAAIDLMLEPIVPETSKKIIEAIMANRKPINLFPRKDINPASGHVPYFAIPKKKKKKRGWFEW